MSEKILYDQLRPNSDEQLDSNDEQVSSNNNMSWEDYKELPLHNNNNSTLIDNNNNYAPTAPGFSENDKDESLLNMINNENYDIDYLINQNLLDIDKLSNNNIQLKDIERNIEIQKLKTIYGSLESLISNGLNKDYITDKNSIIDLNKISKEFNINIIECAIKIGFTISDFKKEKITCDDCIAYYGGFDSYINYIDTNSENNQEFYFTLLTINDIKGSTKILSDETKNKIKTKLNIKQIEILSWKCDYWKQLNFQFSK